MDRAGPAFAERWFRERGRAELGLKEAWKEACEPVPLGLGIFKITVLTRCGILWQAWADLEGSSRTRVVHRVSVRTWLGCCKQRGEGAVGLAGLPGALQETLGAGWETGGS